eukprot:15367054-Ditylum_brightwellii.AAC.3
MTNKFDLIWEEVAFPKFPGDIISFGNFKDCVKVFEALFKSCDIDEGVINDNLATAAVANINTIMLCFFIPVIFEVVDHYDKDGWCID